MPDLYEVLQVHPRAEPEVLRAAYRVLARKYHPDHGGDARRMITLNDAWDVLWRPGEAGGVRRLEGYLGGPARIRRANGGGPDGTWAHGRRRSTYDGRGACRSGAGATVGDSHGLRPIFGLVPG